MTIIHAKLLRYGPNDSLPLSWVVDLVSYDQSPGQFWVFIGDFYGESWRLFQERLVRTSFHFGPPRRIWCEIHNCEDPSNVSISDAKSRKK